MATKLIRNYSEVISRLEALPGRELQVDRVGAVWNYPVFTVCRTVGRRLPTIMLSGGMHGEEPAGVEGVLSWLESGEWERWRVNWFVLPCINPYGWERNQRRNAQHRDINRQFRRAGECPEATLVKRLVRGQRFLFSMEFHEDVDAGGYYLYEGRTQSPYIGEQVLKAVSKVVPINQDPVIDGSEATSRGLIRREPSRAVLQRRRRWPMAYHLLLNCTDHVLGSETALHLPLKQRARAHTVALHAALSQGLD